MNETTVDVVEKMEEADDAVGQLENTKEMIQVFFLTITIIFYKYTCRVKLVIQTLVFWSLAGHCQL